MRCVRRKSAPLKQAYYLLQNAASLDPIKLQCELTVQMFAYQLKVALTQHQVSFVHQGLLCNKSMASVIFKGKEPVYASKKLQLFTPESTLVLKHCSKLHSSAELLTSHFPAWHAFCMN